MTGGSPEQHDLGGLIESVTSEEGLERFMEEMGLSDLIAEISSFFDSLMPQIEEFFASIGITNLMEDEQDEEDDPASDQSSQSPAAIPESFTASNLISVPEVDEIFERFSDYCRGIIVNSEANDNNPVCYGIPNHFDTSEPYEVVYRIHGFNNQTDFLENSLAAAEQSGRNCIIVCPFNSGDTRDTYDRDWMNGDSFERLHNETVQMLSSNGIDINNANVIVEGYSAGYNALQNIAASGTNIPDQYVLNDSTYGSSGERVVDAIAAQGLSTPVHVNYVDNSSTEAGALALDGRPNVTLRRLDDISHSEIPSQTFADQVLEQA